MSFKSELEGMDALDAKDRALATLAAAKWVKDTVSVLERDAKAYLDGGHLKAGGRAQAEISGVDVATVTRSKDSETWRVVDEQAYGAWLEKRGTETSVWEMRPKERVLAADYLNLLRKTLQDTGEVPDGVEVVERAGSVRVQFSTEQKHALAMLAAQVGLAGPLAVLMGTNDEEEAN